MIYFSKNIDGDLWAEEYSITFSLDFYVIQPVVIAIKVHVIN